MLSRITAAIWGQRTTATASDCVNRVREHAISRRTTLHTSRPSALLATEAEVQSDLNRVFVEYSGIYSEHRALFDRYLALPETLRDKVSANMMATMDSLESIAEALRGADARLHAEQTYTDFPNERIDAAELQEIQLDLRDAEVAMQYIHSRLDRIDRVIARMETEGSAQEGVVR